MALLRIYVIVTFIEWKFFSAEISDLVLIQTSIEFLVLPAGMAKPKN